MNTHEKGTSFEKECASILGKLGYSTDFTPGSTDRGLDIIARKEIGPFTLKIGCQCKDWEAKAGGPEIREFIGALHQASLSKGIFFSSNGFSAEAIEASKIQNLQIDLVDRPKLVSLKGQVEVLEIEKGKAIDEIRRELEQYLEAAQAHIRTVTQNMHTLTLNLREETSAFLRNAKHDQERMKKERGFYRAACIGLLLATGILIGHYATPQEFMGTDQHRIATVHSPRMVEPSKAVSKKRVRKTETTSAARKIKRKAASSAPTANEDIFDKNLPTLVRAVTNGTICEQINRIDKVQAFIDSRLLKKPSAAVQAWKDIIASKNDCFETPRRTAKL